jgi:hypothetical protein
MFFTLNEFDEILEKFIRIKGKIDLDDFTKIKGKISKILTTQNGSRVLQQSLAATSNEIIHLIFEEICCEISILMSDSYANYFCQKFYSFLNHRERILFLSQIDERFLEIGISKIGTYPLQAILEQLQSNEERNIMLNSASRHCLLLCQDPQGVHVIEKFLICFDEKSILSLYEIITENLIFLANNVNGLCVAKKIVLKSQSQKIKMKIRDRIIENTFMLIQNPYGNYLIQTAFDVRNLNLY